MKITSATLAASQHSNPTVPIVITETFHNPSTHFLKPDPPES